MFSLSGKENLNAETGRCRVRLALSEALHLCASAFNITFRRKLCISVSLRSIPYSEGIQHLIINFSFLKNYPAANFNSKNPASTLFPSAAYISSTTPSSAASIVFSIFMEEMIIKPSPDLT